MYNGYLDKTMPSELMRNYLKTQDLMVWQAIDIIEGSPVSITIKLAELKKIRESIRNTADHEDIESVEAAILRIETALSLLDYEGIFTVEQGYFNYNSKEPVYGLEKVCDSLDKVKKYINEEDKKYPPDAEEYRWYNVKKWIKDGSGDYIETCEYHIADNAILYADISNTNFISEIIDNTEKIESSKLFFLGDLRLPVPFKAGDLLEADGYPYGPKFRMIILEVGDNEDCCCVQGLARNSEGRWESGAVKHGHVSFSYYPKTSCLYSVKQLDTKLIDDDQILYKVSDFIAGKEENGRIINEKLYDTEFINRNEAEINNDYSSNGMTDEKLNALIEILKRTL